MDKLILLLRAQNLRNVRDSKCNAGFQELLAQLGRVCIGGMPETFRSSVFMVDRIFDVRDILFGHAEVSATVVSIGIKI